jgi:hypothetical protein
MKSTVGGIILALVLFAVGAGAWSEAALTRRVAAAHARLATLHYDADDGIGESVPIWNRLPIKLGSAADDVSRYRATVSYWRQRYDGLTGMADEAPATDPSLLFVSANAAFREVTPPDEDKKTTIEQLDRVIQSYADVLRKDPSYIDAAFNYEFVSRVRDALAKAPPPRRRGAAKEAPAEPEDVTFDLPAGPTIHGRPGGPPDGTDMSDFKTISPMRYDEREEQTDPGHGAEIKRKG